MTQKLKFELQDIPVTPSINICKFVPTIYISKDLNSDEKLINIETYSHEDITESLKVALNPDETCLFLNGRLTLNNIDIEGLDLNLSYCFCYFQQSDISPIILGDVISQSESQIAYKPRIECCHLIGDPMLAFFNKIDTLKEQWIKL